MVIAQLLAEGMRRVLIVVPKPLLGQWQAELRELFGIDARDASVDVAAPGQVGPRYDGHVGQAAAGVGHRHCLWHRKTVGCHHATV